MGFAGYFLVVWDFIHYARQQGMAVGPGRGSSAGSLVAYCLGITNVDPIRYGLLFERFLNPERISMPDMDIDFADDRRDEVIRYVADKYGRDRVAHIITFGTLGAKAAIRDVGRVLGMSYTDVDRIAKLVPGFPLNITLEDAYQKSPPLADAVKSQPAVKELWDIARALEGCTRHASVHASAVVISDEPLDEHIPLYKDPKRPELITGFAMGPIEKLGLLKMDFLGLRTLTVLANTVGLIKESRGITIDLDTLPLDDAKAYTMLSEAKTFGVFQLESSGMREALRGLKPERLEDLIAMVSLYRPGPMELIPDFIARKHGRAKITYEHPAMETFTRETYGIMVYQEQIMQIASEMGGFTMGEADMLRRAMGKKDRDLMAQQRQKFIAGCKERGTAAAKAERVWELMEKFAGYGFNKCLAADTWVEMADGSRKPITAVREGDVVLTKDGPHAARRVRPSGMRQVGRLVLANGMALRCTPDHPIFTQRGWVNAQKLAPDDTVAVLDTVAAADLRVAARRRSGAQGGSMVLAEVPIIWSTPLSYTTEGTEPTYDIEVPGAANFIANGIAVHNSHAAAYGLVAYQTAYFKANYPVEFMAALLTSEMGDTDKIVKYIEECRAMGIRVQPPDVNGSQVRFSVAGDTIRFGLAAIKNVGEAAMESILKTRAEEGAFTTLDDFCVRVDLRLVNRRVIESLIKAGAFDSLGLTRAHLLTQCDLALESGQRQQRERAEGQASFFDLPGGRADAAQGGSGGRGAGVGRRSAPGLRERSPRLLRVGAPAGPLRGRGRDAGGHLVGRAGLARPRRARHAVRPRRRDQGDGHQERQPDGVPHAGGHGRHGRGDRVPRALQAGRGLPALARADHRARPDGRQRKRTRGAGRGRAPARAVAGRRRRAAARATAASPSACRVRVTRAGGRADARRPQAALRASTRASSRCSSTCCCPATRSSYAPAAWPWTPPVSWSPSWSRCSAPGRR